MTTPALFTHTMDASVLVEGETVKYYSSIIKFIVFPFFFTKENLQAYLLSRQSVIFLARMKTSLDVT